MKRILIQNGTLYDGLGGQPYQADLLVQDGRIAQIAPGITEPADQVIDATGKAVTPGFVDIHRHHDAKPLNDPHFGEVELAQGITTAVAGNCGISMTPRPESDEAAKEYYSFEEAVMGPIGLDGPHTYRDYLAALHKTALPLNVAAMIGTGTVKICVKGFADTPYTQQELDDARALIEDAMAAGAPGVSLGIMYLPECYSSTDEFAYILEPVGRYHRVITTHIRGEGDSMVQSVREVIEIARRVDFYPYEGGSTALTTMLPPVFVAGNMTRALEKLGTPEGVEEFRRTSSVLYDDWDNFCITLGWDRIIISGVVRPENEKFLGMRVTEAAEKFGFEDAAALAAYLMHSEDGKTAIINMSMSQDDIDTVARLPWSNVISDAIYAKTDTPHPRMFGAFPKVLREYVAERGIYTMQEAIRRMTSQPAARMGLVGRGSLQKGNYADILVFDPKKFTDHATFTNPAQKATGLDWCIVNGQVAIDHDRRTTTGAGMVLTV